LKAGALSALGGLRVKPGSRLLFSEFLRQDARLGVPPASPEGKAGSDSHSGRGFRPDVGSDDTVECFMTDAPSFASLGLSPAALASLERAKYQQPTAIQQRAISPALAGKDVIGCAATGTGKTAAFVLPIRRAPRREEGDPGARPGGPRAKLALQTASTSSSSAKAAGCGGPSSSVAGRDGVRRPAR